VAGWLVVFLSLVDGMVVWLGFDGSWYDDRGDFKLVECEWDERYKRGRNKGRFTGDLRK
jgi:hypothetical protein